MPKINRTVYYVWLSLFFSLFYVSPPPALTRKTTKFYLYKASKMLFKAQTRLFAQAACKKVFPFKERKWKEYITIERSNFRKKVTYPTCSICRFHEMVIHQTQSVERSRLNRLYIYLIFLFLFFGFLPPGGRAVEALLYNLKTAHDKASQITGNIDWTHYF